MNSLPPLTERIDQGAVGGHEFEHLMHQLLLAYADRERFTYQPTSGRGGDQGIDGMAPKGLPGLDGLVAFQFKWLWKEIHKGSKARQIRNSLKHTWNNQKIRHWILVTPIDLTPAEQNWLESIHTRGPELHHWGQLKIEYLLRLCPSLLARYYPHEARHLLKEYDGFDFAAFSKQYCQKAILTHRNLRTIGLPPETLRERDIRTEIRLRDIFIPLHLSPVDHLGDSQSIAELLRSKRSIIILGDPGAGKSTLLAFVALLYAGESDLEGFRIPLNAVPLHVSLRDFVLLQQSQPDLSFLTYLESRARSDLGLPHAHWAFFDAALRMGEAMVLLDGLDEVGNEVARRRIAHAILNFRSQYQQCPFWITSRIYGYTRDVSLSRDIFVHFYLNRLDDFQIDSFIERWYRLQWPHNEREQTERTASLRRAVHRTPSVQRLAGNPLLLTLMAFIHQGLRRLPQDRGELYEKCVEMLLKTWQDAKREDRPGNSPHPFERLGLHIHTQKDYLAHLALHIQERNQEAGGEDARGLVPRDEVLECLAARHRDRTVRTRPYLTEGEAREEMEGFLDYVSDQTGLLIDRGGGQISFIHLSFQEYLAAWIFTCGAGRADADFFERYLSSPVWQEVLLLRLYIILRTPGGGGEEVFDSIIGKILRRLEKSSSPQEWLTLTRAVRDNLDFATRDQEVILRHAVDSWLEKPRFGGDWFNALEEVSLFSDKAKVTLRQLLSDSLPLRSASEVVACLHLLSKLFGLPPDISDKLRERSDLPKIVPDLIVFSREPGVERLIAKSSSFRDWFRTLDILESTATYRLSLSWSMDSEATSTPALEAAIALVWKKIMSELRTRATRATKRRASRGVWEIGLLGSIVVKGRFHSVEIPSSSVFPSAKVLSSFGSNETLRNRQSLRCPDLALEQLSSTISLDSVDSPFRTWLGNQLHSWLSPFSDGKRKEVEVTSEAPALAAKWFAERISRSFSQLVSKADIANFLSSGASKFGSNFDHACEQHQFRSTNQDFADGFVKMFGRFFLRDFGRYFESVKGELLENLNWGTQNNFIVGREEEFLDALERETRWWLTATSTLALDGKAKNRKMAVQINNPFAIPLVIAGIWSAAAANHFISLLRHLAVNSARDRGAVETWILRNPLEVYLTALSWENRTQEYMASHGDLSGLQGALLLAHAAYSTLTTGLSCDGPLWLDLLAENNNTDPLAHISYLLHEISHSRSIEENICELSDFVSGLSREYGNILYSAGLISKMR